MPKEFYTERDIEDMFKRGVTSIHLNENVVLTELGYEKASRLGMELIHSESINPPSAPVRPYLSQPPIQTTSPVHIPSPQDKTDSDLKTRIRSAVQIRLGKQVDPQLLEVIIQRVLSSTGVK
jgi:hypothetical protein